MLVGWLFGLSWSVSQFGSAFFFFFFSFCGNFALSIFYVQSNTIGHLHCSRVVATTYAGLIQSTFA